MHRLLLEVIVVVAVQYIPDVEAVKSCATKRAVQCSTFLFICTTSNPALLLRMRIVN
jgi:hypothetical protein